MKSIIFSLLTLISISSIYAQADFDDVEITTIQLTKSLYMLQGKGGNIMVSTGDDGILIIDSQYAPLSEKIHDAVRKLSEGPIQYLINTHWHGDHTGGNEAISEYGATIIAHENVLARMSTSQLMKAFSREVPASPEAARPDITFSNDMTVNFNGERAKVFHFDNAHTDGDAVIYFPIQNVMHLGDIYFHKRYPFIDVSTGGSLDGMINAVNQILFLANDKTKIIPGHGNVSNREELKEYRDVILLIRNNIHDAIAAGKTQEEIATMKLGGDYDDSWGAAWIKSKDLADVVFANNEKLKP
jgi:glyoxylase-like metal-dependent hydrolase (beta-lactamase superfamily II)